MNDFTVLVHKISQESIQRTICDLEIFHQFLCLISVLCCRFIYWTGWLHCVLTVITHTWNKDIHWSYANMITCRINYGVCLGRDRADNINIGCLGSVSISCGLTRLTLFVCVITYFMCSTMFTLPPAFITACFTEYSNTFTGLQTDLWGGCCCIVIHCLRITQHTSACR